MKINELLTEKGSGIETWPVSNMLGYVKKFRKIDGWWEHPVEVERWMKGNQIPQTRASMSDERRRQKEWDDIDKEERRSQREAARLKKANRPTDYDIVAAGEDAIGQSFPDGDPSDHLRDYLDKHGLEWSDVNAAFKKIHKKDFYKYLADMWDSHAADALHDAKGGAYGEHYDNEWFSQGNPWK
jgi:hypothetical protein